MFHTSTIVFAFGLCYATVLAQPQFSSTRSECMVQVEAFAGQCGRENQYQQIRAYLANDSLALNGWDPSCCDRFAFIIETGCLDGCYNEDLISNNTMMAMVGMYSSVCRSISILPECITKAIVEQQDECEVLGHRLYNMCGLEGRNPVIDTNEQFVCCWSNQCCGLSEQFLVSNCRSDCNGRTGLWKGIGEGIAKQWQSGCQLSESILECEVQQALSVSETELGQKAVSVADEYQFQEREPVQDQQTLTTQEQQTLVGTQMRCTEDTNREDYVESLQFDTYDRTVTTFCSISTIADVSEFSADEVTTCCNLTEKLILRSCEYSNCFDSPIEILPKSTIELISIWQVMCQIKFPDCDFEEALEQITIQQSSASSSVSPSPAPTPTSSPAQSVTEQPSAIGNFQQITSPVIPENPTVRQESTTEAQSVQATPAVQAPAQQPPGQGGQALPRQGNSAPFGFPSPGFGPPRPVPLPLPLPGGVRGHPPGFPSVVDLVTSGNAARSPIFNGVAYIPELEGFNFALSFTNIQSALNGFRPITLLAVESNAFSKFQQEVASSVLTAGSTDWNRTFETLIVLEQLSTDAVLEQGETDVRTLEGGALKMVGYPVTKEIYIEGCCSNANRAKLQIVAEFQDGVLWVVNKMLYPEGVAQLVYG